MLDAAHRAAYDAAVLEQLHTKLGIAADDAARLVMDMRADRPAQDLSATKPLKLVPGVSAFTRAPFLRIEMNGKAVGQWSVEDARQHALGVLEAVVVADLDANYYRALIGQVHLDEGRSRQVVADIANHRAAPA